MCGRYVSSSPPDQVAAYFGAAEAEVLPEPSFNVAPTDDVPVVLVSEGRRVLVALRWGLVPFWAEAPGVGSRMINARAETLATRNPYKVAFRRRRCIVPADGYYEWVAVEGSKKKQPIHITRPDGEPFAFAGLWESWRGRGDAPPLRSCTIVTSQANEKIARFHDRMPVLLAPADWQRWLDPAFDDTRALDAMLVPAPNSLVSFRAVSTKVNDVRNAGPDLIAPVGPIDVVPTEVAVA